MGQVLLAAAGPGAPGGQPFDLIIGPPGAGGTYSNANSSTNVHNPHIQDTGTFNLVVNGLGPTTLVNQVTFSFGTGPDFRLAGVQRVPEPMSIVVLGSGLIGLILIRRRVT
jgi:hypothetical protein